MSCINTKTFYSNISLAKNELLNTRIENKTTAGRLALTLDNTHDGYIVWDIDVQSLYVWQDSQWYKIGPDPAEADTLDTVTTRGNITANNITVGNITATSFIKVGGTQTQFLKADGSVDSNTYITIAALAGYATENWVSTNFYTKTQINNFFSGAQVISGYNKINWDSAYNSVINSASFNTITGELVLVKQDTSTVTVDLDGRYILNGEKGQPNGVATLDGTGRVPASQLPSYVDDVVEYANLAGFPGTGETGKIYVALDTNKIYRWSGSVYIEISSNDITGSGTTNYTARWTSANTLGTGVLYDNGTNVGIGTTSPLYKLQVNGAIYQSGTSFTSYYDGAVRFGGTNSYGTIVNNLGNIGIGTTSPTVKLHVFGVDELLKFGDGASGTNAFMSFNDRGFLGFNGSAGLNFIASTTRPIVFGTGSFSTYTEWARFQTSTGNLGIGTTTPAQKLDVAGTIRQSAVISSLLKTNASGDLVAATAGTDYQVPITNPVTGTGTATRVAFWDTSSSISSDSSLYWDNTNKRLGIGTTSPSSTLHVSGNYYQYQAQGLVARYDISSANANQNRGVWDFYTNVAVAADFFGRFGFKFEGGTTDSFKQFQIHVGDSSTPKFVVDGSGRVGIGTIIPSERLHVVGNGLFTGTLEVDTVNNGAGDFLTRTSGGVITRRTASEVLSDIGAQAALTNPVTGTGVATRVAFWNSTSSISSDSELYWDNTNKRLGIGTSSPSEKLQVGEYTVGSNGSQAIYGKTTIFSDSGTEALLLGLGNGTYPNRGWSFRVNQVGINSSFTIKEHGLTGDRITIASGGNFGIGTTSPSEKLHVEGNIRVTGAFYDSTNSPGISGQVLTSTATGTDWKSLSEITGVDGTGTANYVAKWSDLDTITNSIIYDNGTNVGIGTTSIAYKLDVNGDIRTQTGYIRGANSSADLTMDGNIGSLLRYGNQKILLNSVDVHIYTNNVIRLIVKNDGNVGIGTSSPTTKLDINNTTSVSSLGQDTLRIGGSIAYATVGSGPKLTFYRQDNNANLASVRGYIFGSLQSGLAFDTGYDALTTKMVIDNTGNIGIGTTTPNEKLEVAGNIRLANSARLYLWRDNNSNYLDNINWIASSGSTQTIQNTGIGGISFKTLTDTRMFISSDGNIGIGTTTPAAKLQIIGTTDVVNIVGAGTTTNKTLLSVDGSFGRLFEVSDDLSDSLFSVNTIAGLPVIEAFADYTVKLGPFTNQVIINNLGNVGLGIASPTEKLHINGRVRIATVDNGVGDFLTLSATGVITERTAAQVLTDIGAQPLLTNPVTGTGTSTRVAFWNNSNSLSSNANLFWDNTNSRLGIGTTSPADTLTVVGTFRSTSLWTTSSGVTQWGAGSTAYGILTWDTGYARIHANTGNRLDLGGNGGLHMSISTTGDVGIGTTSPSQKLHVVGNVYVTGAYYDSTNSPGTAGQVLTSTATGTDWKSLSEITGVDGTGTANYLAKWSDTDTITNSVVYDNGTNVGIGTTSPAVHSGGNALVVKGASGLGSGRAIIELHDSGATNKAVFQQVGSTTYIGNLGGSGSLVLLTNGNGANASESMVITSTGNVGIGTTAPSYKLDIQGSDINGSSVSVQGALNINVLASPPVIGGYTLSAGTSLGVGQYYYFVTYVTAVGETSAGGNLSVVTTSGNTTVNLTGIPVSSDPRVTARKLYRTYLNCSSDCHKFLGTISNNTQTTYTDSTPDASLIGANLQLYKVNTTSRYLTVSGIQGAIIDANLTAFGRNAGAGIISSSGSAIRTVLIGTNAGQNISTGFANVIVGVAGGFLTTGSNNALFGDLAGYNLTTGNDNTIIGGDGAGRFLTTGSRNTIIGVGAARVLADNTTQFTTGTDNIVIGRFAKMLTASDTNSIVIGTGAFGLGSNKTVIGNSSTTDTIIPAGNLGIGTTSPTYKLEVRGDDNGLYVRGANVSPFTQKIATFIYGGNGNSIDIENQGGKASIQARASASTMDLQLNPAGSNVVIGTTTSPFSRLTVDGNQGITINAGGTVMPNIFRDSADGGLLLRSYDSTTFTNTVKVTPVGNVGIGTTNPGTKFHIEGTTVSYGQARLINTSTTGEASINIGRSNQTLEQRWTIGQGTAGIVDSFGFYTGGSNRMVITPAGNVGIGVTAPTEALHVVGRIRVTTVDNGTGDFLTLSATGVITDRTAAQVLTDIGGAPASGSGNYIQNQTAATQTASFKIDGSGTAGSLQTNSFDVLTGFGTKLGSGGGIDVSIATTYTGGWARGVHFNTAGTTTPQAAFGLYGSNTTAERMYISFGSTPWSGTGLFVTSTNNVGIGDTAPSDKFVVNGRARINGTNALAFGNSVGGHAQIAVSGASTGNLTFTTYDGAAFGERMRLTLNGNLGIGTTAPAVKLEVNAGSIGNNIARFTTGGAAGGTRGLTIYSDGTQLKLQVSDNAGGINYWAFLNLNPDGGNVGVGTSSPSEKLHVSGNVRVTGAYYDSANGAGTSGQILSSTATGTSWINNTVQTAVNNGKITVGSLTGTTEMAPLPVATYDGAVYHYVLKNGTNLRAGTINAVWDGTVVAYTEVSTSDIGSTSGVLLSVTISGTDAVLNVTVPASGWSIKVIPIGI